MGIGSGSITHLGDNLFVNTFNLEEYGELVRAGVTPLLGKTDLPRRDLMRYKFLLQLYSLRFDKHEFDATSRRVGGARGCPWRWPSCAPTGRLPPTTLTS